MPTSPIDSPRREALEQAAREDADLIRRTLAGEREAFEGIVRRHHRDLFRMLRRVTRNVEDAEDLTQEAFLRAFRALDRFDLERPFRPWLWTIGIRLALHALARKERGNVSLDRTDDDPEDERSGSGAWWADARALDALDARLLQHELDRAMAGLEAPHRAILVLRVIEERSYEEISSILEIPIGTVMSRLNRARARLKERLKDRSLEGEKHG